VTGAGFQIGSNLFGFGNYSNADSFAGFAGNLTQTGFANTGTGTYALLNNTSGNYDTANGYLALLSNTTGSTNTAFGDVAMANNVSGSGNTGTGFGALEYNTTGNSNSAFGYGAGPTSSNTGLSNTTAIGANAEVDTNNSMVLGSINGKNGATADTNVGIGTTAPVARLHIGPVNDTTIGLRVEGPSKSGTGAFAGSFGGFGDFAVDAVGVPGGRFVVKENGRVGIGTNVPDATFSVNGSADKTGGGSWGTFSDRRLKNLDGTFSSGLSEVLKINPIRYRYKEQNGMGISDHEEHIGVVAQEIQKVIPEAVSENSKGYLLVNNDPIIWAMLNAIKEQQRQIQAQGEQIKQQQKQIRLARKRVEEQESATAVLRQQLHQQRAHNAALESRLIHLEKNQSAGATRIALNQKSLPLTQSRNER
jgi:hypothetical protein